MTTLEPMTIERIGTTEFNRLRVVDSGATRASILPATVSGFDVSLFAIDASLKYRGWSSTLEYYFRNVSDVRGNAIPELFDQGSWFQIGKFIVSRKLLLVARWSRVDGDSGTLDITPGNRGWLYRTQIQFSF